MNEAEKPKNIIDFDFTAKTPEADSPKNPDLIVENALEENKNKNLENHIESLSGKTFEEKKAKFIKTFQILTSMRQYLIGYGAKTPEVPVLDRLALISGMPFDALCDQILSSNPEKWRGDLQYYQTISDYFDQENLSYKSEPITGTAGLA